MKVPFLWLKQFVPVTDGASEVADRLTMRGLEIEGLEHFAPSFADVYVGEVLNVEKHPSADKLSLCQVSTGGEVLPVVCGAPNVAKGQKVPIAVPGARLGADFVIEKRKLRGIESYGMLCSEKELGLSEDHSGIFILPETLKPGDPLTVLPEIDDYVLEVNVPPNRGDCQSILGIAREVASAYGLPVTLPEVVLDESDDIAGAIGLSVLDTEACPRYVLRMVKGVAIVPSPFWMRSRIHKAGMRAINAVVDVTNYIMLELGQPLHAFDYSRIADRRIEVRVARESMTFRTLDGVDRRLEAGDTLICDGSGPVALAGVMGGENSEIRSDTHDVALESAFFNPLFIRRTARRLDLRSEASARFEKGIDLENVDYCARRAIDLLQQTSGGTILRGSKEVYERRPERLISLGFGRTSRIIGTPVSRDRIVQILESIGVAQVEAGAEKSSFSIPSYRHDLIEDFDLIEEVARIVGYANIPAAVPVSPLLPVARDKKDVAIDLAKDFLTASGFFEVINYGFFSTKDIERFAIPGDDPRAAYVPILNPISKELAVMRTFLASGVLENLSYNTNRGTKNLRIFEIGKAFFRNDRQDLQRADHDLQREEQALLRAEQALQRAEHDLQREEQALPRESLRLCCALSGKEREFFWRGSFTDYDFFDLKGVLEGLFERFNLPLQVQRSHEPFLDRTSSADIVLDGRVIGWCGELRETLLDAYDIREKVFCAEVDFDVLAIKGNIERTYRPVPRFPAVTRDFSFYVDDSIPVKDLAATIREVSPLIVSVGIFDIFRKEVRSISFRVVFQSYESTLTDESVNALQQIIIDRLTKTEGIKLRT